MRTKNRSHGPHQAHFTDAFLRGQRSVARGLSAAEFIAVQGAEARIGLINGHAVLQPADRVFAHGEFSLFNFGQLLNAFLMLILPAIDLMDGQVVRLEQGRADRKTVYHTDPIAMARQWQELGAAYLHLVDLDGAFHGVLKNLGAVRAITSVLRIPCELGGGLRSLDALEQVFAAGVSRAIIGSKACESLDFIRQAVQAFGGERIAVGIDAKDGKVAIKGWVEVSSWDALDLAREVAGLGVRTVIYTDISTDGMLAGPNLAAQRAMRAAIPDTQLIASGGVGTLADIEALQTISGLYGVIVGKALYDGKIDLPSCLAITR